MASIFISPSKYIQGRGELSRLACHAKPLGAKPLVLISEQGYKRSGETIEKSFGEKKTEPRFEYFAGECSESEIERLCGVVGENGCDVIIGVGGGKILDTAKAVAYYEKLPVVVCPTAASTDAPCSALSVIYTDDGEFERYLFLPRNPDAVIMDLDVIAASPVRLTVSGMGDALATYFEARAAHRSAADNCAHGKPTNAAMNLARLCYDTLISQGLLCKLALERGACTKAVESVVEANTLLSGIGFESGGLGAAHAVHNGLTLLSECHKLYHGEKVAFGTLTQLVLENAPSEELDEVASFCVSVGLPLTLAQLGLESVSDKQLDAVSEAAAAPNETSHNMPFEVTPQTLKAAILGADAIGHYYLDTQQSSDR